MSRKRRARLPLWATLAIALIGALGHYFSSSNRTAPAPLPREYSPSAPASAPREIEAPLSRDVVIYVTDGDTIKLQNAGTIRLIGVDCPEKAQAGGQDAKAFTTDALLGKTVDLEVCARQPHDRYGRTLGFIYLTDGSGQRVLFNSEIIRQGYGNVYSLRPCEIDEALWQSFQDEARANRRGLFASLGEVPNAAEFRRARKRRSRF